MVFSSIEFLYAFLPITLLGYLIAVYKKGAASFDTAPYLKVNLLFT